MSSIDSLIANYNPDAVRNANLAAVSNSNLAQSGARLNQSQADEVALKNKITQRQLHDEEIYRQILADVGRQSMQPAQPAQPPEGEEAAMQAIAPGAVPAGSPAPASPPQATGPAAPQAATPPASPQIPDLFTNPRVFQVEAARRGMSGAGVMSGVKQLIDQQSGLSKLNTEQLDNEVKAHGLAADSLRGYLETPDGAAKPQAYAAFYEDLSKEAPEAQKWLPKPGQGVAPTSDDLAHVTGMLHLTGTLLDAAKTKQDIANNAALLPGQQADSAIKQIELGYIQGANPASIHAGIADAVDKAGGTAKDAAAAISAADLAFQSTLDPKQKAANAGAAAAKVIDGLNQTNTAVRTQNQVGPLRTQEAAKTAAAVAPIHVREATAQAYAVAPAHIKEQVDAEIAKAKATGGEFADIIDPTERHAVEAQYNTASKDYLSKVAAARNFKATIDAARGGNKAAAVVIPISELKEFTNRVNRSELNQIQGAGNLSDKIQGFLNGATDGQPIPRDILNGMEKLADIQEQSAKRTYDYNLQIVNKHGAKATPIEPSSSVGSLPRITTKAAYDALPSGASYTERDGKTYRKP